MKKTRLEFGVTSQYFSVYKAFKEEAHKLGVAWVEGFNLFEEDKMGTTNCIWVSSIYGDWYNKAGMSFSNNTNNIDLDTNFSKAIEALREFANEYVAVRLTKEQIEERLGHKIEIIK